MDKFDINIIIKTCFISILSIVLTCLICGLIYSLF